MKHERVLASAATALLSLLSLPAEADDGHGQHPRAAGHAPIGVMADHRHETGEWMLSYRFMRMEMDGNRIGTTGVTPDVIVTGVPNRFAGAPMQPPTLRVVPLDMTMDMHMLGAMYGLTDRVTLMAMGSVVTREMDHVTYRGGMGTDVLGGFTTEAEGLGDTMLTAIVGLDDGRGPREVNVNLGVSLPTGGVTEEDDVLTPMDTRPTLRLPYAMQLGSGTFDLRPGFTYRERRGEIAWGAQGTLTARLDENDEGYALGDRAEATAWLAYEPVPWVSGSVRLAAATQGDIEGMDPAVMAPVQTADPANYGGETVEVLFGVNVVGQQGALRGHRVAAEIGLPVLRDLNGPQMETDLTVTLGWQKAFGGGR